MAPLVDSKDSVQLPIQEDETALVLYALWKHYQRSQDIEFIAKVYPNFVIKATQFLLTHRDKNTGLSACVKGKEILVANVYNQFYCLDARCTHAGAPLSEEELDGNVLTCPWHSSRFNVTDGSVVRGPAVKMLKIYRSIVAENHPLVEL